MKRSIFLLLFFQFCVSISRFHVSQSFNLQGIFFLTRIFKNPSLMIPSLIVKNVTEINPQELLNRNVKGVILDKDNTITRPYSKFIENKQIETFLANLNKVNKISSLCRSSFASFLWRFLFFFWQTFNGKIAILSNSIGSLDDVNFNEAHSFQRSCRIPVIKHFKKKPNCLDEVLNHFSNTISSSQLCMIGKLHFISFLVDHVELFQVIVFWLMLCLGIITTWQPF